MPIGDTPVGRTAVADTLTTLQQDAFAETNYSLTVEYAVFEEALDDERDVVHTEL